MDPILPLRLEIDSHVIHQLGEELITDTGQALLELVKNSYDADADYCHIEVDTRFDEQRKVTHPSAIPGTEEAQVERYFALKGRITVRDNGHGMSYEAIRRGWLTISLSQKRAFKLAGKVTSKHRRSPLGDKGLGRIGTLKLGDFIVIETFQDPSEPGWQVSFSWADCKQGGLLSDVPISIEMLPARGSSGTTLAIMGLNDLSYWKDSEAIKTLTRQMSTLLSPFKSFESFNVTFKVDFSPVAIESANTYLNAAQGKFTITWIPLSILEDSCLEVDGLLKLILFRKTKNDISFRQYIEADQGRALYEFLSKDRKTEGFKLQLADGGWFLKFSVKFTGKEVLALFADNRRANPGPFMGEIYDIDITEGKSQIASQKATRPQFLDNHNGVFIYRDNFRIRMGDDWLGLGERWTRGASYYGLRPGNTLGWISISAKDNQQLIEKSDREGFVDNPAKRGFESLARMFTQTINDCIAACRRSYNDFLVSQKNVENRRDADYGQSSALAELRSTAESSAEIAAMLADNSTVFHDVASVFTRLEAGINSNDTSLVAAVLPDVRALANKLSTRQQQIPQLIKTIAAVPHAVQTVSEGYQVEEYQTKELYSTAAIGLSAEGLVHEISSVVQDLLHSLHDLEKVAKLLGVKNAQFFGSIRTAEAAGRQIVERIHFLDPMLRNMRGIREAISVSGLVAQFEKHKSPFLHDARIKLSISDTGKPFRIKANRGRMMQVLDNLLRNSVYWLQVASQVETTLLPEVTLAIDKPFLFFSDNGFGIEDRVAMKLFDAFVTGKTDGTGHGLGLFLSQQLVTLENSSLSLLPSLNCHGRPYKFQIDLTGALDEK